MQKTIADWKKAANAQKYFLFWKPRIFAETMSCGSREPAFFNGTNKPVNTDEAPKIERIHGKVTPGLTSCSANFEQKPLRVFFK